MKFEEAFDKVYEIENERSQNEGRGRLIIQPGTAKSLAFLWSMLAVSQNVLDDIVSIDQNNNIVSFPVPGGEGVKPKGKKGQKSSMTAENEDVIEGDDGAGDNS